MHGYAQRAGHPLQCIALVLALLMLSAAFANPSFAGEDDRLWLTVTRPYAEMHTGPGRGYPVFNVVSRGEAFTLLRQRADWLQVETADGKRGWMHRNTVEGSQGPGGERVQFGRAGREQWRDRRFEIGFAAGDFSGDPMFSFRAGYRVGPHFVVEGQLLQAAGSFSSTSAYHTNIQVLPFLDGRVTPFFSIGAGRISNEPKSTLVDAIKVDEWAGNAGIGVRAWLTRRFILRGDVRQYVLTRDINNNDDFTEITLGFSVFF